MAIGLRPAVTAGTFFQRTYTTGAVNSLSRTFPINMKTDTEHLNSQIKENGFAFVGHKVQLEKLQLPPNERENVFKELGYVPFNHRRSSSVSTFCAENFFVKKGNGSYTITPQPGRTLSSLLTPENNNIWSFVSNRVGLLLKNPQYADKNEIPGLAAFVKYQQLVKHPRMGSYFELPPHQDKAEFGIIEVIHAQNILERFSVYSLDGKCLGSIDQPGMEWVDNGRVKHGVQLKFLDNSERYVSQVGLGEDPVLGRRLAAQEMQKYLEGSTD